jgi:ribosomal protein L11 methyltransferase
MAMAVVDDFGPAAVEAAPLGLRLFFRSPEARDDARAAIGLHFPEASATPTEVSDEDWAERSQAAITAVTIGAITVSPPWLVGAAKTVEAGSRHHVVIQPSMGFGTGHHASTRLCLLLMQQHLRPGMAVLDVGTGSGVLAIAARLSGAAHVVAMDTDPDALENARENIALNAASGIELVLADIGAPTFEQGGFDLAFANLTGSLLCRTALALVTTLTPGGTLIASGFQLSEEREVVNAFATAGASVVEARGEQDWLGVAFRRG